MAILSYKLLKMKERRPLNNQEKQEALEVLNYQIRSCEILFLECQKIFPLSHPASLLYNPSYEDRTMEQYKKLINFL